MQKKGKIKWYLKKKERKKQETKQKFKIAVEIMLIDLKI